jgi:hypothetical protein
VDILYHLKNCQRLKHSVRFEKYKKIYLKNLYHWVSFQCPKEVNVITVENDIWRFSLGLAV